MTRTIKAIIGSILILIITFSAISIIQNLGRRCKIDLTEDKLYTLSDGTKAILSKIQQPIKARLYYAKTAALKGPDDIRFYNIYFEYVKAILEEYEALSNRKIELEIIDPRPYSEDEEQVIRYQLQRYPISEDETFVFGLVIQTEFGVVKTIPFFTPDRQSFIEYDISYLIDTALTREKKRVGVLSSLEVMGQDVTGYMAQLMMAQGQRPKPPWLIIQHLRDNYTVTEVPADTNDINDVDILLVIHPKGLTEQTQFAIDQFILKGGRAVVFVDPHCLVDRPQNMQGQMMIQSQSSEMDRLLRAWGLEMPANTLAGDKNITLKATTPTNQMAEPVLGIMQLIPPKCFNQKNIITRNLNQVRVFFAGILKEVNPSYQTQDSNDIKVEDLTTGLTRIPLLTTTEKGNYWTVSSPIELMYLNPKDLMSKFVEGRQPVSIATLVTGKFKSAFPEGIDIQEEIEPEEGSDSNEPDILFRHIDGLTEAKEDCAVVVITDVDLITDERAYQSMGIFGSQPAGDNSAFLLNIIEDFSGSSDLISVRTRGNYRRPFTVVDEIEKKAEEESATKIELINLAIQQYNAELDQLITLLSESEDVQEFDNEVQAKQQELKKKIRDKEKQLIVVQQEKREGIDKLGNRLRIINMAGAPIIILVIAIVLEISRSVRKRHYISHASDA